MSEGTLVGYRVDGGIAVLELDAPPANTYSYAMMRQLDDAILRARFDPEVHVLVIRGAGDKFFCAGADIGMLRDSDPTFKYHFCLHANETLGGGLEVALAADLRVARKGPYKIGLPEARLGVLPGTGGTQRLARLLGKARAIELMAEARNLSVDEAHTAGIVQRVLDGDDFDVAVLQYAGRFVPPGAASMAVGHIKRAVQSGLEGSLQEGLALERELQQRLFESADAGEGLEA